MAASNTVSVKYPANHFTSQELNHYTKHIIHDIICLKLAQPCKKLYTLNNQTAKESCEYRPVQFAVRYPDTLFLDKAVIPRTR